MTSSVPGFEVKERKLKAEIEELNKRRKALMTQLGEVLYERTRNTSMRAGNELLFDGVEKIDSQRLKLQSQLEELRRANEPQPVASNAVCPRCGSPVGMDDAFCMNCGCKVEHTKKVTNNTQGGVLGQGKNGVLETKVRVCPKCGNRVPDDDIFCMVCGTKLGAAKPIPQPEPKVAAPPAPPAPEPPAPEPVEQPSSELRCPSCGTVVEEGYLFCIECGAKLESTAMAEIESEPEPKSMPNAETELAPEPEPELETESVPEHEPDQVSEPEEILKPEQNQPSAETKHEVTTEPEQEIKPAQMLESETAQIPAHARSSMWPTFGTKGTVIDMGTSQSQPSQTAAESNHSADQGTVSRRQNISFTQRCPRCGAPVASTDRYCAICAAALP